MKKALSILIYVLLLIIVFVLFSRGCEKKENYIKGSFTDPRDSNVYKIVAIGNQIWMADNLKYLPTVVGSSVGSATTPYYYVYGYSYGETLFFNGLNVEEAKAKQNYYVYGVLYNWEAARLACPDGWHLPSDADWSKLIDDLGDPNTASNKLKRAGSWYTYTSSTTNESGFSARPGGGRGTDGLFTGINYIGYWWSATEGSTESAWYRSMSTSIYRIDGPKELGLSVRCLKN